MDFDFQPRKNDPCPNVGHCPHAARRCPICLGPVHEKAVTLQSRINRHYTEWLIFADDRRVPPTNNLAERALRPLVVLRKTTFGHRSKAGADRMAKLMSVAETARRQGHRASDITRMIVL